MVDLNILTTLAASTGFEGSLSGIGWLIYKLYESIGSFGWTVVLFTVILKALTLPLDIWTKHVNRKNSKAMERIKPQLEKLQKIHEKTPEIYQQKQMELYKKEHYSMMGACLPAILTLVIFMVVFGGFNKAVKYHNELTVYELAVTYNTELEQSGLTQNDPVFIERVDKLLLEKYDEMNESWLWIENIFVADSLISPVMDENRFTGTGIGRYGATLPNDTINIHRTGKSAYEVLLGPAMEEYATRSSEKANNSFTKWITKTFDLAHTNGFFILPILSIALSIITTKMAKKSQVEPPPSFDRNGKPVNSNAGAMKMMNYLMPVMIGVFSLFYSSAFTIYMFFNSLITVIVNIIYNMIVKGIDKKEELKNQRPIIN